MGKRHHMQPVSFLAQVHSGFCHFIWFRHAHRSVGIHPSILTTGLNSLQTISKRTVVEPEAVTKMEVSTITCHSIWQFFWLLGFEVLLILWPSQAELLSATVLPLQL